MIIINTKESVWSRRWFGIVQDDIRRVAIPILLGSNHCCLDYSTLLHLIVHTHAVLPVLQLLSGEACRPVQSFNSVTLSHKIVCNAVRQDSHHLSSCNDSLLFSWNHCFPTCIDYGWKLSSSEKRVSRLSFFKGTALPVSNRRDVVSQPIMAWANCSNKTTKINADRVLQPLNIPNYLFLSFNLCLSVRSEVDAVWLGGHRGSTARLGE